MRTVVGKPYLEHNLVFDRYYCALTFCGHVCYILKDSSIEEKLATMERIIFCLLGLVIMLFLSTEPSQSCYTNTNGCSIPGNLPFFYKRTFKPACFRHDVCYECVRVHPFLLSVETLILCLEKSL